MEQLIEHYHRALDITPTGFVRYLEPQINWNSRVIAILGARGVGKTTLLRQHIKLNDDINTSLYVDAGDVYFSSHSLIDVAETFYKNGGRKLYIDEIHRYANWSAEVKMIHDFTADFQVVYSGSSILDLEKGGADLSRRKLQYYLAGMSFREYLELRHGIKVNPRGLEEVIHSTDAPLSTDMRPLNLFKQYLREGYYPFSVEEGFLDRLTSAVNTSLVVDIPQHAKLNLATINKLRKLFYMIAQSVPFQPNISQLARALDVSRNDLPDLIEYLNKAQVIRALHFDVKGLAKVASPDKILLDNTCLSYAFSNERPAIGTLRETAFCQMIAPVEPISASRQTDFKVGAYSFEVGGRNKGTQQVSGLENAYIVRDDTEYRSLNFIPLWHFGFLY
ncbi:MAG: AAA family ATPase [Bacteroidales bacterium]|nr:AAA family ATPase [Bacteroidales bacterium]